MKNQAATSIEQLDALLAEGKVSQEDYESLRAAMERKEAEETRPEKAPPDRKLRRSMKNRQLGGVCAGIGEHLGVDPNLIRIGAVILFFLSGGAAIIVYSVLVFVLPVDSEKRGTSARTVALTLAGLWITHTVFLLYVVPLFLTVFHHRSVALSESTMFAITLRDLFTPLPCLVVQAGLVALIVLIYAKLPAKSSARTVLWVGALASFIVLMVFYVVALFLPYLTAHGDLQ